MNDYAKYLHAARLADRDGLDAAIIYMHEEGLHASLLQQASTHARRAALASIPQLKAQRWDEADMIDELALALQRR